MRSVPPDVVPRFRGMKPVRVDRRPVGPSPIRVAFVVHVMQVAGAEMLVAEAVRRLAGRIEPTVLCLDAIGALGERLLAQGVPVVCLGRKPGLPLEAVAPVAPARRSGGTRPPVHAVFLRGSGARRDDARA